MVSESQNHVHVFAAPPSGTAPQLPDGTDGQGRGAAVPPSGADTSASRSCAHAGGRGGGVPKRAHLILKMYRLRTFVLTPAINQLNINVSCLQCRRQNPQRHPPKRPRPSPRPSPRRSQLASQAKSPARSPARSLASGRQRNPQRSRTNPQRCRLSPQRGPAEGSRPEGSRSQRAGSCFKATCLIISV